MNLQASKSINSGTQSSAQSLARRQWHIITPVGGVLLPCGWFRFGSSYIL
nr:MAG TPA: hypothetical protein [Bacteriophage sp.]